MLKKVIIFLIISIELLSFTLEKTYYVDSNDIKLFDVVPDAKYDLTIYQIDNNRYSKRVKSKELIKLLKKHGIDTVESSSRYIKFLRKSNIDTSKIESEIIKMYKDKYPNIDIKSIIVTPRGFIKSIPEKYSVIIPKRAYLSKAATISIKTQKKQKIFFDYMIDAKVDVFISNQKLHKGDKISSINTSKKTVVVDRFKSLPINEQQLNNIQVKLNAKPDSILTMRDVELLNIVNRGSYVNAFLKDKNINITFSAKALQNGKLRDIITVQKANGQRLQAIVIGKNKVEIK